MPIEFAESEQQILECYPTMGQLRTHLSEFDYLKQVNRQISLGYRLVYLEEENEIKAVAGFRVSECLAWGKFFYVDDLVTNAKNRSKGYGDQLFDWLVNHAKENSCHQFHLDSGVQRFAAHRFYLRKKMIIASHHFVIQNINSESNT